MKQSERPYLTDPKTLLYGFLVLSTRGTKHKQKQRTSNKENTHTKHTPSGWRRQYLSLKDYHMCHILICIAGRRKRVYTNTIINHLFSFKYTFQDNCMI